MNNKGFYNNKEWAEKVKTFFKESGFYVMVVVGLCILAVGAVYFTTNHLISSPEEYEDNLISDGASSTEDNNNDIALDDKTAETDDFSLEGSGADDTPFDLTGDNDFSFNADNEILDDPSNKIEAIEQDIETHAKPTIAPTNAPVPTKAPAPTKAPETSEEKGDDSQEVIKLFGGKEPEFVMPAEGEIIMDYAMDRLLYSKTLDEWRTHTGIDIVAPRGDVVKAAADGYIKEIKEDPCYGITITIDHENGYKTIYSNLASSSMVSVNQKVKAGDAISSIGNTAIFECMDPPHLHFEVYKNDKLIDPKTVLPKMKD